MFIGTQNDLEWGQGGGLTKDIDIPGIKYDLPLFKPDFHGIAPLALGHGLSLIAAHCAICKDAKGLPDLVK